MSRFRLPQSKSPPNDKGGAGRARGARAPSGGGAGDVDQNSDEGDGFFVDAAPSQVVERPVADGRRGRAADRRRERGRAPEPVAPKDTRTAMVRPDDARGADRDVPRRSTGQYARPAGGAEPQDSSAVAAAPTGIVAARVSGVRATLTCLKGPENGRVLELTTGSYTVGRARENEFVLKDIAASRRHLQIDVDDAGARLTDLGSGNGTKVNGKRAATVTLRHGDTIELGGSLLVFADAGRPDPVDEGARDQAQARVVAAADELARELHEKLRFGDGNDDGDDGYVAQTAALRTADARAGADAIARERKAAETGTKRPRKLNEREWNETFTNVPLSAVVPGEQPLQGTAANRADPRGAKPKGGAPLVAVPPVARAMGPVGTAAFDGRDADRVDLADHEASMSSARQSPFVSALLSAFAVLLVGALGFGLWALLRDPARPPAPADPAAVVIAQEREADFRRALDGMQAAYAQGDWAKANAYASTALQLHPDDAMALRYQRDSDEKLKAARAADAAPSPAAGAATTTPAAVTEPAAPATPTTTAPTTAPTTNAPTTTAPTTNAPTTTAPTTTAPTATAPTTATTPPPTPRPPARPVAPGPQKTVNPAPAKTTKTPTPKPAAPGRKAMSEEEASTQFARAVRALQSKDTDGACRILESIIDRGPRGSKWQDKADSLFAKKCGN